MSGIKAHKTDEKEQLLKVERKKTSSAIRRN